jgi:HNH endonuclease
MGQDPDATDNRWLRDACNNRVPIIYFLGIAPGRYQAMLPTFICGWDANALRAQVAFGAPDQETLAPPETALERRYALRAIKQRLHQASFREAVITAYNGRCALSGLPEPLLLDAAHIVEDKDEQLGQPVVPNGIPLSKIHHAAFDAHLIGIDPDYRLHVSGRLLGRALVKVTQEASERIYDQPAAPLSGWGQKPNTSFGVARPLPPGADISPREQSVGQAIASVGGKSVGAFNREGRLILRATGRHRAAGRHRLG